MNISIRYISLVFLTVGSIFLITSEAAGQRSVTMSGGNQTLTITTGIAGGQLTNVTNTSCTLTYGTGARIRKITVQTTCAGQSFNLSVVATNVTRGTAQSAVTLVNGAAAVDFIRDIAANTTNATCRLQYTASATFAQGCSTEVGNDVHTVTYTIITQ
jgi:hypothetical protein